MKIQQIVLLALLLILMGWWLVNISKVDISNDTTGQKMWRVNDHGLQFSMKYPNNWQMDYGACNQPAPESFIVQRQDDRLCFMGWAADTKANIEEYYQLHYPNGGTLTDVTLENGTSGKFNAQANAYFFDSGKHVVEFTIPANISPGVTKQDIADAKTMINTLRLGK